MFIPLLQRERSIDDFVDKDEGCRLAALLADKGAVSQEDRLYLFVTETWADFFFGLST